MSTFTEKFSNLPADVKEAIVSEELTNVAEAIASSYKLRVDKTGKLIDAATDVMIGALAPQDFIPRIIRDMEIPQETAVQIAKEINEKIFLPIRETLKKIHAEKIADTKSDETDKKHVATERGDLLKAIEAPETIPMKQTEVNVAKIAPTFVPPVVQQTAKIVPPEPAPKVEKVMPTPAPKQFDPYRELPQ